MRFETTRRAATLVSITCLALALALAPACSGGEEASLESAAAEVEENVEDAQQAMKDTWEAGRAQGEGVVEAAGEAYEEVLEEGREKAAEKK